MPAGRSRQPRTNTRTCGPQPAHQSLLNRRLDGSASGTAQSLHSALARLRNGIAHLRQTALTTNIGEFLRENWLSNRIFASYEDILDHCCAAWNRLTDQPWRIMTIELRDWAYRF